MKKLGKCLVSKSHNLNGNIAIHDTRLDIEIESNTKIGTLGVHIF